MKIKITQEHIDAGQTNCFNCPIALAGREQIEGVEIVEVGSCSLFTYHSESDEQERDMIEYKLPKEARQFVRKFDSFFRLNGLCHPLTQDRYECPEPFEFELGVGTNERS